MAKSYKAPEKISVYSKFRLFLAGTIDMGVSENWQAKVEEELKDFANETLIITNPRRDNWDPTWEQDPSEGTPFYEQVQWELDNLHNSDYIFFNFADNSKSPITLLELGLFMNDDHLVNKYVIVNKNFYRYGNVVLALKKFGCNFQIFENLDQALTKFKEDFSERFKDRKVI